MITYAGSNFTILEMDKNRIARVKIERLKQPAAVDEKRETW
jgi:CBS domain containing-hemolysin-like protein